MADLKLALRLLARDWRAGELGVLVGALVVAVAALTAVAFFTSRVSRAVELQAAELLAGLARGPVEEEPVIEPTAEAWAIDSANSTSTKGPFSTMVELPNWTDLSVMVTM